MEKIRHVFMLSCIKHACFHVFSAYFSPHDIIAEKGLLLKETPLDIIKAHPQGVYAGIAHCLW